MVFLVSKSAREGRGEAGRIPGHFEVAHRHLQSVLCVVKRAIVWSCGLMRMVNVWAGAAAASQRYGYLRRCVVAGSSCKEERRHFPRCFLRFPQVPGLQAEVVVVVVVVEAADAQLAAWLTTGNSSLCR